MRSQTLRHRHLHFKHRTIPQQHNAMINDSNDDESLPLPLLPTSQFYVSSIFRVYFFLGRCSRSRYNNNNTLLIIVLCLCVANNNVDQYGQSVLSACCLPRLRSECVGLVLADWPLRLMISTHCSIYIHTVCGIDSTKHERHCVWVLVVSTFQKYCAVGFTHTHAHETSWIVSQNGKALSNEKFTRFARAVSPTAECTHSFVTHGACHLCEHIYNGPGERDGKVYGKTYDCLHMYTSMLLMFQE